MRPDHRPPTTDYEIDGGGIAVYALAAKVS